MTTFPLVKVWQKRDHFCHCVIQSNPTTNTQQAQLVSTIIDFFLKIISITVPFFFFLCPKVRNHPTLFSHQVVCPTSHRTPRRSPTPTKSVANRPLPSCCWASLELSLAPRSSHRRVLVGLALVDRHPRALGWRAEDHPTTLWPDTRVSVDQTHTHTHTVVL